MRYGTVHESPWPGIPKAAEAVSEHCGAAVLITRGRIEQQLGKIAGLAPLDERRKAFRLLIAVLAIAGARNMAVMDGALLIVTFAELRRVCLLLGLIDQLGEGLAEFSCLRRAQT
ncbi:DUF5958 family protein [Streptomyces sp. NPDC002767]